MNCFSETLKFQLIENGLRATCTTKKSSDKRLQSKSNLMKVSEYFEKNQNIGY